MTMVAVALEEFQHWLKGAIYAFIIFKQHRKLESAYLSYSMPSYSILCPINPAPKIPRQMCCPIFTQPTPKGK